MTKEPSERKPHVVQSDEYKTYVLNEWMKSNKTQLAFVEDYNKRPWVQENPGAREIERSNLSRWAKLARENPDRFPGLKSEMPESSNKPRTVHSDKYKTYVLSEWRESGKSQLEFAADYNKRPWVQENSRARKINHRNLRNWAKVARENPGRFSGLESEMPESSGELRADHSGHSADGQGAYEQAVAGLDPSDIQDLWELVDAQLVDPPFMNPSAYSADGPSETHDTQVSYAPYPEGPFSYGQESGQGPYDVAGGAYAMPQGMGQLTVAAPTNPSAAYAAPDPFGSGQSGGQGGWPPGVAVSTYPVNFFAGEVRQYNAWSAGDHNNTSGPSAGYQQPAPAAQNKDKGKTKGQRR
ncbi:hypothetical protein ABTZ59_29990 [Streptomyces sp. NPDC094034]|uniref:hypothetical protein n=1 Tax=Streptomyces sp. NPDC094034 TaxID=3155309 RepID=UPI0033240C48